MSNAKKNENDTYIYIYSYIFHLYNVTEEILISNIDYINTTIKPQNINLHAQR